MEESTGPRTRWLQFGIEGLAGSTEQQGAPFGESAFPPATEALLGNRRLDNLLTYRIVFLNGQLTQLEVMEAALARFDEALR